MSDLALWTTLISAAGAGMSAIGAVVMTNRGTVRRDRQQQEEKDAERQWLRRVESDTERNAVLGRLLKTASRVKARGQLLGGGFQPDMRDRLNALQEDAMTLSEESSMVTLLYASDLCAGEVAVAAQDVASAASKLVADLGNAIGWERTSDGAFPSGGEVTGEVSFDDFDTRMADLQRALAPARANGVTAAHAGPPQPQPQETRLRQSLRVWFARRDASSR